jgi:hypothetical protein
MITFCGLAGLVSPAQCGTFQVCDIGGHDRREEVFAMTGVDRVLTRVVLAVCIFAMMVAHVIPANADKKDAAAATTAVDDAAKKGFPLTSSSTDVTGNVSVEATLIPAKVATTVFGKEVANNYAVIALTISNRSSDDSFIVHTIFIDYSQWLLSGSSELASQVLCLENEVASSGAKPSDTGTANGESGDNQKDKKKCSGNLLRSWQQQTWPNQISTVETRIVRGELLDRQPWTTRNWVLRALQGAGSVAAGFTFITNNQNWIRGIGAYNAHFIPAAQNFWPDATVGQMNRISDVGFQVNKVIAKQSSDIVVAFFPIDRFLSPGLRQVFLQAPAVFFSPYAMLLDPKRPKLVDKILNPILSQAAGTDEKDTCREKDKSLCERNKFLGHLPAIAAHVCDKLAAKKNPANAAATDPLIDSLTDSEKKDLLKACQIASLLDRTSLNTVRVIVGGTMTVDVNKVPPQITDIQIDQDKDGTAKWKKGDTLTGVIRGSFLSGATPSITKPENMLQAAAVGKDSTDTELHITVTPSQDLGADTTTLTFQVSKKSDGTAVTSGSRDYKMLTPPTPAKKQ